MRDPVITIVVIIFLVLVYFANQDRSKACEEKGGVIMKTRSGYECIKGEKIPLE